MKAMSLILPYVMMVAEIEHEQKLHREKILDEWENSKNYPRKKKKAVRKGLLIEWQIANWQPMF